jgi:hypothetical protein
MFSRGKNALLCKIPAEKRRKKNFGLPVRLLDAARGGGRLAGRLSGQLLTRRLTTRGLPGCLFSARHTRIEPVLVSEIRFKDIKTQGSNFKKELIFREKGLRLIQQNSVADSSNFGTDP